MSQLTKNCQMVQGTADEFNTLLYSSYSLGYEQ